MTPAQLRQTVEAAQAAQQLQRIADDYPMALARLWRPHCTRWNLDTDRPRGCGREMVPTGDRGVYTCRTPGCPMRGVPEVRTSQRDTAREILTTRGLVAYMVGGANRAGKSELAMLLALALAAGSGEWWVREFLRGNGIPADATPAEPATGPNAVIVSALTFNDSKEYHRPKLDRWAPKGSRWRNRNAENQAELTLPNGGRIVCKAEAQGRKAFQGTSPRAAVLDEEHSEEVFEEVSRGLAETDGPCILSMTPLMGLTWTYQRFLAEPPPGHLHSRIIGLDNPHVRSRGLLARFSHLTPERRDARLYGKYAAAKGLIYPSFSDAVHIVRSPTVGDDWRRFRAIDFGYNFACLWGALSPDRDQLVIYRELKTQDVNLSTNARQIIALSGAERYDWTLADPADKDARNTLARDHQMPTYKALKDVEAGIDAVLERLAVCAQGYPRLIVSASCVELLAELRTYRRKDDGTVRKEHDHLADCLRYMVYFLSREVRW